MAMMSDLQSSGRAATMLPSEEVGLKLKNESPPRGLGALAAPVPGDSGQCPGGQSGTSRTRPAS